MSAALDRLKTLRRQIVADIEAGLEETPPREGSWLSLLAQVQAAVTAIEAVEREGVAPLTDKANSERPAAGNPPA